MEAGATACRAKDGGCTGSKLGMALGVTVTTVYFFCATQVPKGCFENSSDIMKLYFCIILINEEKELWEEKTKKKYISIK